MPDRQSHRRPANGRTQTDWLSELISIIAVHIDRGARGRVNGAETQAKHKSILILSFREIRRLGYKLNSPRNFREKHLRALITSWEQKGIAPATLQNRISTLRLFCSWIGKPGMIKHSVDYVQKESSVRRTYVAKRDKSWRAHDVDAQMLIRDIESYDRYVAMQLELILAFGLRRREAVMLRPHRADRGFFLAVHDGTKGGRDRVIEIRSDFQREVLDRAKKMAKTLNGHIGNPNRHLKQNLRRFSYVMNRFGITQADLGVTAHGLRHQFLQDRMQQIGVTPPVRGGEMHQDQQVIDYARHVVAEEAGHTRLSITSAYCGTFRTARRKPVRESNDPDPDDENR